MRQNPRNPRHPRFVIFLLLTALACPLSRSAAAWTPVPPFPEDGVAVGDVADTFDDLRAFLRGFESAVDAQYAVCVVRVSDRQDRGGRAYSGSTVAYVDHVFAAWRERLHPERGVVIAIALANRGVAIHPGSRWTGLGFEQRAITGVIDGSSFARYARAGDYTGALQALVLAVDMHLGLRERQLAQLREDWSDRSAAVHGRLTMLSHNLARTPFDTTRPRALLTEAERTLSHAEEVHALGSLQEAVYLVSRAEARLERAELALSDARELHRFRTETLPKLLIMGALLLVLTVLVVLRWVRARHRRQARQTISGWKHRLTDAGDRLVEIENGHPLVFGARGPDSGFTGATLEMFEAVGRKVDDLFIRYMHAQRLVAQADQLAGEAGALSWSGFDAAHRRLTIDEVELGADGDVEKRLLVRSPRSSKDAQRLRAGRVLQGLEEGFDDVQVDVASLEEVMRVVPERLRAALTALSAADAGRRHLGQRGFHPDAYTKRLTELEAEHQRTSGVARTDPVGAEAPSIELLGEAEALQARLARARAAAIRMREKTIPAVTGLGQRMRTLRVTGGLRLSEPGFEPEAMTAGVLRDAHAMGEAIREGDDERAAGLAERAAASAAEIERLLEATLAARETVPAEVEALRDRRAALSQQLPERSKRLLALREEHADEALQPALDNAEEAEAALTFSDRCLDDADAAAGDDEQRYLQAAELVRRAVATLRAIDALYAEIEDRAALLAEARDAAAAALQRAQGDASSLSSLLSGDDRFATEDTLRTHGEMTDLVAEEADAHVASRPDWLTRRRRSEAMADLAAAALARAREERAAFASCLGLRSRVAGRREAIAAILAGSEDDRPPANASFDAGEASLAQAERLAGRARPDWPEVLALLESAAALIDRAEREARDDIEAAEAARRAVREAATEQSRVDRSYGHGVRATLDASQNALRTAREALLAHNYELALTKARNAEKAAADAERAARRRVRRKKAAAAERAARRRAASSSSSIFSSSSSSSSSSWSSSSSSSSSSWSGGSSFGSSSGGSSYSSSSGGSSW
jgi:uncharacterized membrane protein YgcG